MIAVDDYLAQATEDWSDADLTALAAEVHRLQVVAECPAPGDLAVKLDPSTVQTPALELIDAHLVELERLHAAGPDEPGKRRLMITLPPQEGKSVRVSQYASLWALLRDPSRRLAEASYDLTTAARWGREVRNLLETYPWLGLTPSSDSRAAHRWQLKGHRGGMYCVGVGGALTGRAVDWLTIDDPVKNQQDADSLPHRERVWDWWTSVAYTRLAPGAVVVLILTRWHADDLAGRLLAGDQALPAREREWLHVNIPAQAEPPDSEGKRAPDSLGRRVGEYLRSARGRTVEQWENIRRNVGERVWGALYQQNPTPREGGVFKWEWIRRNRLPVGAAPHLVKVAVAVDTSAGGSDEAGIVAAGRARDERTYVVGDRSGNYSVAGWAREAWLAALDYEADVLVWEANLVGPIMATAIPAAWRRLRQQAQAIRRAAPDGEPLDRHALADVARALRGARLDDPDEHADDLGVADLADELLRVQPYAARILRAPEHGPCRTTGVHATRGKQTRAEPVAQAYETDRVSHVGYYPQLEAQQTTWQEGQDSPDRMDACLVAGTRVLTRHGETPIERVSPGDEVWTRIGWKPVLAAAMTRRQAQVLTVEMGDGGTLTGTPEHRVWVEEKGWRDLDTLVWGDRIQTWTTHPSPSSFSASPTDVTPTPNSEPTASTTRRLAGPAEARSTETYGSTPTAAPSRPDITSTTPTTTRSTTTPATSSHSHPDSTTSSTPTSGESAGKPTSNGSDPSPQNGTDPTRAANGTANTGAAHGRTGNPSHSPALHADTSSSLSSPAVGARPATAPEPATAAEPTARAATNDKSPAPSAENRSGSPSTERSPQRAAKSVHGVRVEPEPADVFNLQVAELPEYVANGLLVHNCVWAWTELNTRGGPASAQRARGRVPTGTAAVTRRR